MSPPIAGPTATPASVAALNHPMYSPLLPSGAIFTTIAVMAGRNIAKVRPWSTLTKISSEVLSANG